MMKSFLFMTSILFATLFNVPFAATTPGSDPISSTEPIIYSRDCGIWKDCHYFWTTEDPTWGRKALEDFIAFDLADSKRGSRRVPKWRHPKHNNIRCRLWKTCDLDELYGQNSKRGSRRVPKWRHPKHNNIRCRLWKTCDLDELYGQRADFTEFTESTESAMSTVPTVSTESSPSNGPHWEHFNPETSVLPSDAIIGGYENETLYIIRAAHKKSLTPGKYVPSQHKGYIPWGYKAHEKDKLEILRGNNCKWVHSTKDIPKEAVVGGNSEHYHDLLYVCRGTHLGHTIPGKIDPHYRKCYIPYHGMELEKGMGDYEVLVVSEESSNKNKSVNIV